MPFASQEARREYALRRYASNPDARRKAAKNAAAYRHKSPEARERWRQWKRNARAKKGATPRATTLERAKDKLAEQNARQAWRWWLKNAPDGWMAAYYEVLGRPWCNPRLTYAEKYVIRYRLDECFAKKERERVSNRRFTNPEYGRIWEKDGKRWRRASDSADGSVTKALLKALQAETHCAYCRREIASDERHIDHVWPLSKGGTHTADNLVMACAWCNRTKRDSLPLQFMLLAGPSWGLPHG